MERLNGHTPNRLQVLIAIFVFAVLFGHAAQSAPVRAGEIGAAQSPASEELAFALPSQVLAVPPGIDVGKSNGEIEALSANATQLLQEKYGYCITKRSAS